jgi:hypothetical protein
MRFGRETWSIDLPAGWRAWHDDACATIVGSLEVGALQVSAAFKDSEVLRQDLLEFAADHIAARARPAEVVAGDFMGIAISFEHDGAFWHHWYLRNGAQELFITYNCAAENRGVEDAAVQEVLKTLRASGT